jgi:5-methyltetrahydrofolate--homocysteine methyltransferase
MNSQELLDKIAYNVIQGRVEAKYAGINLSLKNQPAVTELMQTALEKNLDPKKIIVESLVQPMEEVIEKYKAKDCLGIEVLASAHCAGAGMEMLKAQLKEIGLKQARFVIAVVKGDLHTLGAEIVEMMLKGFGYETINLGPDVSANRIADAIKNHKATYVGLSAFYASARVEMEHVMSKLEDERIRSGVRILIGGAAASAHFAEQIGADAYCENAFEVIDVLKSFDHWSGFVGANLN